MPRLTAGRPGPPGTPRTPGATPGTFGPGRPVAALGRVRIGAALRRHAPYLVCGTGFWLVLAIVVFHTPIGGDFGQNAAAVARISENWRHPANPVIREPGLGSPYFSPYLVALGFAAKATGTAAWVALRWSGLLNLAVLVAGVGVYAHTLSRRPLAPVYALAAFTLLWGWQPEFWSGFCGLASLSQVAPYPSTFAVGLTFLLWAWTDRVVRRGGGWWAHAGLGALGGTLLLIHPITALAAASGVAATVVARQRRWTRWTAACWGLTLAVALSVAAAWPYFDVFALAGDTTVDAVHRRLYEQLLPWYGLALTGLPALALRARRGGRDPLVLMFGADCAIAGYGWLSGHYTYGRVFALLLVPLQFALAVELAEIPPWTRLRAALVPLTAAALGFAFVTQVGSVLPRAVLPALTRPPTWHDYRWVADRVPAGDVLLTDGYESSHILPAFGVYTVWPAWPDPSTTVTDRNRRSVAVSSYFDPHTSAAARRAVVHRYDVRWLLLSRGEHVSYEGTIAARSPSSGETLVRLRPAASA
ncbi:hypothetical protein [Actinacidiphila rubida]|uniref:Integral membrane protein n=1 Tax=Actinacidiphila rubida TaxID=310780 RepID=A0A1H8HRY3_9ACTN|nr:hypothetical protein [Actinacidiphila rubida]SEN58854.1 hypothetical protein SAMN05216267_100721 [Actinacidiphila rubida]